jgi:type VI secretion system protein ImpE
MTDLAERKLAEGDLSEALKLLQDQVRAKPSDVKLRIFLFQILSVIGNWERAIAQLSVCRELDVMTLPMVQTYQEVIRCELLRAKVFRGETSPIIFGQPQQWMALLVESLTLATKGCYGESLKLREQSFELAPSISGTIDADEFSWIADSDTRLGPVFELIVNGKYYWVPSENISSIVIESPVDLRDLVWLPAQVTWTNGGAAAAFIPARYPGSETTGDTSLCMARKTEWIEHESGHSFGLGQKVFTTNEQDYSLFDIREIRFNNEG